ncbi:MAG: hypothetical protein WA876_04610 [Candidatus Acidiferrales bacterium]
MAQNSQPKPNFYLISATVSGPTKLYTLDHVGRLQFVRTLLDTWPYEIADDQQGTLYIIQDSIGFPRLPDAPPTIISIIHENEPQVVDTLTVDQENFAVAGTGEGIAVAVLSPTESCLLLPNVVRRQGFRSGVTRIMGVHRLGEPREQPGHWTDYTHLVYAGNREQSLDGWMTTGVVSGNTIHVNDAVLGPAPDGRPTCPTCGSFGILAASARFLALTFDLPPLWVYDKAERNWRSLPFRLLPSQSQRSFHSIRIFGEWLAGGETASGSMQLLNLLTGKAIELPAAADNGDVLAVNSSGTVLYRSNDSLFSVPLVNGHLGTPVQLASDPIIDDVHWAFRAPA